MGMCTHLSKFTRPLNRSYSLSTLSEFHQMLQNTCRSFAQSELSPVAAKLDKEQLFPAEQIKKMGQMGLMGILVSEEYGGANFDSLAYSVAIEEIAKGCAGTGAVCAIHNALYAETIYRLGTTDLKKKFLPDYVNGTFVGGFALSEPGSGSDAAGMLCTAVRDGNSWILNGIKSWVTNGYEANAIIVIACSDKSKRHKGITAFIVPTNSPGLSRGKKEDKLGIRASSTCNIILEDVRVPDENILGNEGEGFKVALSGIDCARIGIASQALGIAQASLDCAIDYAGKRIAFGNPILKLQAVQHRLSRMTVQLESARLLTWRAAELRDKNCPFTKAASMAKLAASEAATSISHNCIQILGGMGYVSDMPAERYYRDARITEIYAGPTDIQLLVIAEQLSKEYGLKSK